MVNRRPRFYYRLTKRIFDILAAGSALVLLAPVLAIVALLIRLTLGRPVFFRQERPGLEGAPFALIKFRTMHQVDARAGRLSNEQRMTPLGRWLRAWSVDELPSLINILRGDMSLVGPRPLLVKYLPLYTAEQALRHSARPGLTGLAQVSGRNSLPWNARLELDVYYVRNASWGLDLSILGKTALKVLRREGIASAGHAVGEPFSGTRRP